jgi:ferredoxin
MSIISYVLLHLFSGIGIRFTCMKRACGVCAIIVEEHDTTILASHWRINGVLRAAYADFGLFTYS